MSPLVDIAFASFVTFLAILDPPGTAVAFIALTRNMAASKRRGSALMAILLAGAVLLLFALVGRAWLSALGIGLPALRIAGGLMLFLPGTEMILGRQPAKFGMADAEASARDDITVFPLAFPLIAGPGAMTSVELLMGRAAGDLTQGAVVVAMLMAGLAIVAVALLQAGLLIRLLRATGCHVIARVMGVNLAALAVQFIVDGLHDVLLGWSLLR